jgi:penicillin amidase
MNLMRFLAVLAASTLAGCAALRDVPPPVSTEQRLAAMPTSGLALEHPVTILWTREQIPYVEAASDHDAAYALGLVHAHLRLGQIETLRRLSQGRLAEMAGPIKRVRDVEQMLRILDLGKTSKQVYAQMPADSKAFLDAFVAGINEYQKRVKVLPHEYGLLGLRREPFAPDEILTIARLASVDVSWLVWMRLLQLRNHPEWPELWREALDGGTASAPSFAEEDGALKDLTVLLASTPRVGSNSFAVGGAKTRSHSAIIASDPHLGISLPNVWLLAGVNSPSYHAVGMMIPGLPFVAVGRNEKIAWGGTNMRSAASDLFDVSSLPRDQITTREVDSRVRWWRGGKMTVRDTPYGPIISDSALIPKKPGEEIALKWIGHLPSDEFTAMLAVNRATDWNSFREALAPFAISAQNFIYADTAGNIGQLTATHLPKRSAEPPGDLVLPLSAASAWDTILTSRELPQAYNPAQGFVATANNKPADTPYPIGYFFSGDDRVLRMREVLGAAKDVTADDLKRLQTDTYMRSAARLRDALVNRGRRLEGLETGAAAVLDELSRWNARFDLDSKGAVAFDATLFHLVPTLVDPIEQQVIETGGSEYIAYANLIDAAPPEILNGELARSLSLAHESMLSYPTWGDMHRLPLSHNFGVIPVIGGRYRFADLPWPGSTETLWRADHNLAAGRVNVGFGAVARHISDMSDLDSNWFALLGGNDGWINSANFMDEVDAFRDETLIQLPLRPESVRAKTAYTTILSP